MKLYIHGSGCISPQQSWGSEPLLSKPVSCAANKMTCVEPDYSQYIDIKTIRRMSRIIKMGIASASMALDDARLELPNAIITGTGYGCLEDTGIFLSKMVENNEVALNPTPFIQSTHNTIGSQIALLLQCLGYNQTYTQGGFSFENVLLDALLQASENPDRKILIGGIDEITEVSHAIQSRFGKFRDNVSSSLELFSTAGNGTLNGEGASFFVVSGEKNESDVCLKGVRTSYRPTHDRLSADIVSFLEQNNCTPADIDVILLGESGDSRFDNTLELVKETMNGSTVARFKHLSGEYSVASAFAVWLASKVIRSQRLPEIIIARDKRRSPKNILIYNQYFGTHHSMILLSKC